MMTVAELKKLLDQYDDTANVVISTKVYEYDVLSEVTKTNTLLIYPSPYHGNYRIERPEVFAGMTNVTTFDPPDVVVLRSTRSTPPFNPTCPPGPSF